MYHNTAKGLAALGRNGDSMLMHVNPNEVAVLSQFLGPTTTNPKTGLPEAYGWSNLLGSALTGMGSFGVGAALSPVINEALGGVTGDLMKEAVGKAVPALAGAGLGAAIGGATGGKAGALGGALQGGMSGGLGAFAAEDVFPQMGDDQAKFGQLLGEKPLNDNMSRAPIEATPTGNLTDMDKLRQLTGETQPNIAAQAQSLPVTPTGQSASGTSAGEKPGFFDNLGTAAQTAFTKEGFKKYEDYVPYLFQAGMIGNAVTSEQESKDSAQQAEEEMRKRMFLTDLQATNLARSTYGYAGGGPVIMQSNNGVPVQVRIPEHLVDKVKSAGGMPAYMQGLGSYATGGYINLNPEPPQGYYPMSQIASAHPYPAATPQRQEVIEGYAEGGLLDGEGDGMSDDIDANIEGQEPIRVADGEFIVPKHIVDMIGVDRLDDLLRSVRKAAYGREEQINEDAGLEAAKRELGIA